MASSPYGVSPALKRAIELDFEIRKRMAPMLEFAERTVQYQKAIWNIPYVPDYAYQSARFMPPVFNESFIRQFEYASRIPPEIFKLNALASQLSAANHWHVLEKILMQPTYVKNAIWETAVKFSEEMPSNANHVKYAGICQKDLDLTFEIVPDDVDQEKATVLDKIKAMFPQFTLMNISTDNKINIIIALVTVIEFFINNQQFILERQTAAITHQDAEIAHQDAERAHQDAIKQNEINEAVLNELKEQTKLQKQILSSNNK